MASSCTPIIRTAATVPHSAQPGHRSVLSHCANKDRVPRGGLLPEHVNPTANRCYRFATAPCVVFFGWESVVRYIAKLRISSSEPTSGGMYFT